MGLGREPLLIITILVVEDVPVVVACDRGRLPVAALDVDTVESLLSPFLKTIFPLQPASSKKDTFHFFSVVHLVSNTGGSLELVLWAGINGTIVALASSRISEINPVGAGPGVEMRTDRATEAKRGSRVNACILFMINLAYISGICDSEEDELLIPRV